MKIFLIAGELSGDKLGAALMAGLKSLRPDVEFLGVGGPLMAEQGLTSLFPMEELSVMGLAEILPKYPHLRRRMLETVEAVLTAKPDVLLTIDSPDFCLRVAKRVKAQSDIRTVHYVAPSVWAWRPKRAAKMAGFIDQVLALLPFEPPYMEAHGMRCDFVGHPVVAEPVASDAEAEAFRARHATDGPILLLLPGSRRGEVTRLLPIFKDVVAQLTRDNPALTFVLPAAAPVAALVKELTNDWPKPPLILDPSELENASAEKRAAFKAADLALAASGTVSIELAANGTPMVIAYDMNWLSRRLISRMLLIDTVTLVNLVTESRIVPEFIGADCQPDLIAPKVAELLGNAEAQTAALTETMRRLGKDGEAPGLRAARALLEGLSQSRVSSSCPKYPGVSGDPCGSP